MTPADAGLITPSGLTSIPAGMETPDAIELRKKIEDSMESGGGDTPALYQVRKCGYPTTSRHVQILVKLPGK